MSKYALHGYSRSSELFQLLRDGRPMTRAELADVSGLARTTVSSRVDELMQSGLVTAVDEAPSTGGRPSSQFSFDPAARLVLAFNIWQTQTSVAVTDLSGAVLGRDERVLAMADGPDVVLKGAIEMAERLLEDLGKSTDLVVGIGVALVGYAEISAGRQEALPAVLRKWTGSEVEEHFYRFLPVPVLIDNDVNVMALGEHTLHPNVDDLIFVNIGGGVGAGIIAGGELQRGASNMAGGLGHARVPRGFDVVCRCGNTGCLEAHISVRALGKTLRDRGLDTDGADDISALVQQGDSDAVQAVRQAGRDLGSTLAVYVSILNPSLVAVSDPLGDAGDYLLDEMRKAIYEQASPMVTGALLMVRARSAEISALVGAARMVNDHVLSPAGIEDLLAGRTPARAAASV